VGEGTTGEGQVKGKTRGDADENWTNQHFHATKGGENSNLRIKEQTEDRTGSIFQTENRLNQEKKTENQ